jgi:hypothetical protein
MSIASNDLRSRLPNWLGILSLLIWCASFYLWYQYAFTRPTVAQPSIGRIYGLNTHGSVVYLTSAERLRLFGLQAIAAALMIVALLVQFKGRRAR